MSLGLEEPSEHKTNNWYLEQILELTDGYSDESIKEDLLR